MTRSATAMPSAVPAPQLVAQHLFFDPSIKAYALIDGASAKGFLALLKKHDPPHFCLYRGEIPQDVAERAPYLVELEPDAPVTTAILEQGWGNHWGIFAQTAADIRAMRKHFRTFLMVNGADGTPLYFRYYDPRVLQTFLPTCTAQEASVIFGPVRSYLLEAADKTVTRFRLHEQSHMPVGEPVNRPPEFVADNIPAGNAGQGSY